MHTSIFGRITWILFAFSFPIQQTNTGAFNWCVDTGNTMSQWKCEIKYVAYYESLQLIYLGEQMSLFIALYAFVFLWDSSLHSSFFPAKLKVW